jgi:hypothetical protein
VRRKPPKEFQSSKLDLAEVAPGQVWRRLYLSVYPKPLGIGYGSSRFSDPRVDRPEPERYGVIYLGSSLRVCFLEAVLRDRRNAALGEMPLPYAELQSWNCADIGISAPLKLVDLRDDGPVRMGVPTDAVRASTHRWGQAWALAFWSHVETPDGIIYPSRLNGEANVALYDRALPKIAALSVRPLLDCRAEMTEVLRTFRIAVL